ncbi:nucleotidyltransferase family protein [Trichlorobacter ammonificans]|uniref:Nucleoside-diphosphate-sugar pyrophosphorylase n=1 Tax=Trichlorobacter ammonificans TaxID=2916410 RepID=A0ABM9DD98_9BACT|nr:sugar phosphate nucleotidyltransferase [Trichlorobacter ammonificans]CAH2032345.1 Nucleoside-diphosphate-sugar pyrophosphorylase [Trichlorobacter ammonificans]
MMAIILAGGLGTRLKPFTVTIPKPLLPLGNVPILEVVVQQLSAAGVKRIVLTLGHMAPFFTAFLDSWAPENVKIEYCIEKSPLGTAGSLALIQDLEDDFIVMNGDILTTLDFGDLFSVHMEKNAWGTIALSRRDVNIDYGVVESTEDNLLKSYIEKPSMPYYVSMGINVLTRRCLEYIPAGQKFDMPQLMSAMKDAGRSVVCYKTDCYWQDIGRFDDYQQASEDFDKAPERFMPQSKGA